MSVALLAEGARKKVKKRRKIGGNVKTREEDENGAN